MTDPADRTYPTTITNILTTTRSPSAPTGAPLTIDHITLLDPWPTSPDPQSVPFTLTQTALTQRTISAAGATPTTLSLNSTIFYKLWTIQALDMVPYEPPVCPGPGGCSYPAIKPHAECSKLKMQTRCAAQCQLKDWMWWCRGHIEGERDYEGRVCARTPNATEVGMAGKTWEVELLEPCDHTDLKPGCTICDGYEEEDPWIGGEEGGE
ncbi:hypothetical protein QBC34DRAFT_447904 [Podospora aff. communis PSN243]|uniref:Uncharacterized protein n=1 Tax=Podospora aff. communis PSN243 TaxID=3040156 RepID=A0AAV9GRA4_9PEZI|nr:hypothetical protein QBC34DRAFT_447904 [Podospora aff. communis PSN243]